MDIKINNINQYTQKWYQNKIIRIYKINDNRIMQIIELIKKIFEKLVFWKFQRILLKTILNGWFQFLYLQNIFFKWFDSISFVFNF